MSSLTADGPLLWYLNRASGLVLLVLLTAAVALGVLALGGRPAGRVPRFAVQHLHRNVGLLAVAALGAHITTAVVDDFVDIGWWDVVVPGVASYHPLWLGLGALSLDLLLAVVVTSLVRHRLPERWWRRVHLLAWAAWVAAVAHTVGLGTDVRAVEPWAATPAVLCVAAVLVSIGCRVNRRRMVEPEAVR